MSIKWIDLTVDDAEGVRDFYAAVAGWKVEPVTMGDYDDYSMLADGSAVAGICHARGSNADLPPVWLPYFGVDDLDASLERCCTAGGKVISGPRSAGPGMRFAVVRDPAGAAAALIESV